MITFILAVCGNVDYIYTFPPSPPSRAAWIEIEKIYTMRECGVGRRLHGRRGLKYRDGKTTKLKMSSPPSRAAWIEIPMLTGDAVQAMVAAFTGGVD